MPVESPGEKPPAAAEDAYALIIRQQVVAALGGPAGGAVVRVRALWGNKYRVNVFHDANPADGRITRSYFLAIDDDGTITHADPALPA